MERSSPIDIKNQVSKYQIIFIIFSALVIGGLIFWIYTSFLPRIAVHRAETPAETLDKTVPASPCIAGKGFATLKIDCLILDEQYCGKGELLYDEEEEFIGLGFNLPEGTKIYAPFDGYINNSFVAKIKTFFDGVYYGFYILEKGGGKQRNHFAVIGEVKTIEPGRLANEAIQKEQLIAKTTTEGKQKISTPFGNYDIIIYFTTYDIEKNLWSNNIDLTRQFFPYVRK